MSCAVVRNLPFEINRADRLSFVEQTVCGIRQAINTGVYVAGDRLPTWKEMARQLGVSEKIPRTAIGILSQEGLVVSRRSVGAIVADGVQRKWQGRVIVAVDSVNCASYFMATMMAETRRLVMEKGYLFDIIACPPGPDGTADCAPLVEALKRKADLCVINVECRTVSRLVSRLSGTPILAFDGRPDARFRCDYLGIDYAADVTVFVRHCRQAGVRRVLDMNLVEGCMVNVAPALRRCGVRVETLTVRKRAERQQLYFSDIIGRSLALLRRRLADGRWPDLIVFNDDYVAIGGLQALLAAGIDVPKDVKVVTYSNRGFGPVFLKSLTRFELDPYAAAGVLARRVLAHLGGRPLPQERIAAKYVTGETFPNVPLVPS